MKLKQEETNMKEDRRKRGKMEREGRREGGMKTIMKHEK